MLPESQFIWSKPVGRNREEKLFLGKYIYIVKFGVAIK